MRLPITRNYDLHRGDIGLQSSPPLTFRPAAADDWPRIAGWIGQTWEWGDYIRARLWYDWIGSKIPSFLNVVEHEGQIVGFYRLVKFGEAEWWLEGVRVQPKYRGQGVGQAVIAHAKQVFREHGAGLLRFFTSHTNEAMIHLSRGAGFRHRLSYTMISAPPVAVDFTNYKILTSANVDMVWQYLRVSPMYRANHFVEHDWAAYFLIRDRLADYLADPQIDVIGWRNLNQLQGLIIVFKGNPDPEEGNPLAIGYIDAADDTTLRGMLEAARGLAFQRGHDRVAWRMPLSVGLERPIAHTDYERTSDSELWLFELPVGA